MRKAFTFFALLTFSIISFSPAASAAQVIVITEPTHRLSDGTFFDDLLATKLTPTGELGRLVYTKVRAVRAWQVDPATIEEIVAMSNGYGISNGVAPTGQQVAKDWLDQFNRVSRFEAITALSYGNPSNYWAEEIIAKQFEYLNLTGQGRLESILSKSVNPATYKNEVKQDLNKASLNILNYSQRQINLLATAVDQAQLDPQQLRLAQLLNPSISEQQLKFLIRDYDKYITQMRNKLRISGTKFTVTSTKEDLPITVANSFEVPVKLKLSSRAINSKVIVVPLEDIEVDARSKKQVLLPIEVLAAGDSRILMQLTNLENKPVGYPVYINLKLSVISPVATWITTGAAILLFIAVLVQSLRRVRRRGNE